MHVCDIDAEGGARDRSVPSVQGTASFEGILDDPELDTVLLATPVHTHFELARSALDAGKHTFVEKPLASSSEEAEELLRLAEESGREPDVRAHVHLQPCGTRREGPHRQWRARRDLLHIEQPREPRASST